MGADYPSVQGPGGPQGDYVAQGLDHILVNQAAIDSALVVDCQLTHARINADFPESAPPGSAASRAWRARTEAPAPQRRPRPFTPGIGCSATGAKPRRGREAFTTK